ncbi:DUF6059 family protein [Streptomyces sp. A012304]|uniref:DUF6059 family protein n=1 Tax=Streptomyces sp. A012304 TaxID=375446 RepID=UPI002231586B|nr:DUF6059 family protein [Streptomyces sp. A012304]GKQ37491.1 hypothetical protein ALMP_40280 [Streptomyces sp. A012304]
MRRVRAWLGRAWHDMAAGLVAVGHCFGALTPPECYGFAPYGLPPTLPANDGPRTPGPSVPGPVAGHPERLVTTPLSALPAHERALWGDLADVWDRPGPG